MDAREVRFQVHQRRALVKPTTVRFDGVPDAVSFGDGLMLVDFEVNIGK